MSVSHIIIYCFLVGFAQYLRIGQTKDNRLQELLSMSIDNSLTHFDEFMFKRYVKTPKKNYSIIIVFTALSYTRQCLACRMAYEATAHVALSWKKSPGYTSDIFFGLVDYDSRGAEIFKKLKLKIVPFIHVYQKGFSKHSEIPYNQVRSPVKFAKFLSHIFSVKIDLYEPINKSHTLAMGFVAIILSYIFYNHKIHMTFVAGHFSKYFSLGFITLMLSGHMWNTMHQLSFTGEKDDETVFINRSKRSQYLIETFITFFLIGGCSGVIVLLDRPSKLRFPFRIRPYLSVGGILLFCLFFKLYVNNVRLKLNYPAGLLF